MFRVSEQIKHKDMEMHKKLKNSFKPEKKKKIELGDSPENLMKQNSYKRSGRRMKQTRWSE